MVGQLAVRLIRHIFGLRRQASRTDGVLTRRKLTTIVDCIMANLHGSPTLEQMAGLVQLSPYHFARQFKAATGLPPHQFLITRRVEPAQQIPRERGGLSLAEVVIGAGFSDQSQLCFYFKGSSGNFWSPQKSLKSKREQVPPIHWVGTYLAYSSPKTSMCELPTFTER